MLHKFQNNFLNNNDLITPVSSCAIWANVALELNVHSVKKKKTQTVFSSKGEFLMTSQTCRTCAFSSATRSTI